MTKGFQEPFPFPSDSPTTSRETIKLFLAIAANEGWPVESSDVSSEFLQSDAIDRDIFIQPPPERETRNRLEAFETLLWIRLCIQEMVIGLGL